MPISRNQARCNVVTVGAGGKLTEIFVITDIASA
jgi:hypothetical protein